MVGNAFSAQTPIKPENIGKAIVNVCVLEKLVTNESKVAKF
jgi:hypothetical protein